MHCNEPASILLWMETGSLKYVSLALSWQNVEKQFLLGGREEVDIGSLNIECHPTDVSESIGCYSFVTVCVALRQILMRSLVNAGLGNSYVKVKQRG